MKPPRIASCEQAGKITARAAILALGVVAGIGAVATLRDTVHAESGKVRKIRSVPSDDSGDTTIVLEAPLQLNQSNDARLCSNPRQIRIAGKSRSVLVNVDSKGAVHDPVCIVSPGTNLPLEMDPRDISRETRRHILVTNSTVLPQERLDGVVRNQDLPEGTIEGDGKAEFYSPDASTSSVPVVGNNDLFPGSRGK